MFDRLFDEGLITFSFKKEIIISKSLSVKNTEKIGIQNKQVVNNLPINGREDYLDYHHHKVFLR
ncbi:hypothetical protein SPONN_1999 [uncultured Candidatus Thioglobus sp.]|nr:hypothetical protein SPONN_1999 [uncultured Candidatus Thioglobus sp.]